MRATEWDWDWKCFKEAGRGYLKTAGFKQHWEDFQEQKDFWARLDSLKNGRWVTEKEGALPTRRPGPSHQLTNDKHGFFIYKNAVLNTTNTASVIFCYCNSSQNKSKRHIAFLKAVLQVSSKNNNNLTNRAHSQQSSAVSHTWQGKYCEFPDWTEI